MMHAFTVDVEDWYQGIPLSDSQHSCPEQRLEIGCDKLLALLDARGVRGTFFILGPVAQGYPNLVRRIAEAGHELGCHGWSHDLIYEMTPERFREETRRAVDAISDVVGYQVTAYRAAYFSITRRSFWALEILAELGFRCDSSIFPVQNWRYGIPGFNPYPQTLNTPAGDICEIPLSVRRFGRYHLPAAGGAYFRLYPYALTSSNMRKLERCGQPAVFYIHPWELDPDHPRVSFHWKARVTHYVNLATTERRLARLLDTFQFGTLAELVANTLEAPPI